MRNAACATVIQNALSKMQGIRWDQTTIDVSAIPDVRQGDEVVLIGVQEDESITAEEVAERLGTINYEVVSEILARVPRVV